MRVFMALLIALVSCGEGPRGSAGPQGEPGEDGEKGETGAAGAAASPSIGASIYCNGQLQSTTLFFVYSGVVFKTGDVFAYGGIKASDIEAGASAYFAASQMGAASGPVLFTFDLVGADYSGWWRIEASRSTGVVVITYNDLDLNDGSDTWTMTPDKCVINRY